VNDNKVKVCVLMCPRADLGVAPGLGLRHSARCIHREAAAGACIPEMLNATTVPPPHPRALQILNVYNSKGAEGLSAVSFELETLGAACGPVLWVCPRPAL
jgi:hypothetical protein